MNNLEHLIIIRFSVKIKNSGLNEKNLFSDERLKNRFYLFEKFCLWGIINQSLHDFKVIIVYDENLPQKWKNKLINLTSNYNYIYLHKWNYNDFIGSVNWLEQYMDSNKKYKLYTRLDDDDIINKNINKVLKKYLNKNLELNINKYISFAGGKFINYDCDKFKIFRSRYQKPAIFYSRLTTSNDNKNVFTGISHDCVPDNMIKVLKFRNSWGILNHPFEDSNRYDRFKNLSNNIVSLDKIYQIFSNSVL
ncbi:MAG: hypothetical protein CMF62_02645 [Magnetococcales bacterium]|nr:hypothetical protein [Magnetococcales bacterium]|tara:strand:+ start:63275 stop:64021 length:747 start_codon:yes stop_codon:yes gene_type:complete